MLRPYRRPMTLRDATPADVHLIADLHVASWRDAYRTILDPAYLATKIDEERRTAWMARFADPPANEKIMIAEDRGAPAGFVCILGGEDRKWGSLVENLHVLPGAKGQGLGARLLCAAAEWSQRHFPQAGLYLWVYEANGQARGFYERMGGSPVEKKLCVGPDGRTSLDLRYHWPEVGMIAAAAARRSA